MLRALSRSRKPLAAKCRVFPSTLTVLRRSNTGLASLSATIDELKTINLGMGSTKSSETETYNRVLGGSYSTKADGVLRERNTDDITRLWSLLDVLLEDRDFTRARSVLASLEPLLKEDHLPFIDDLNKYLAKYAESSTVELHQLDKIVSDWYTFHKVQPNARTFAILTNKALVVNDIDPTHYITRHVRAGGKVSDVFAHIDVLGIDQISKLVENFDYTVKDVPEEYRHIISNKDQLTSEEPIETSQAEEEDYVPTLQKSGADDLKAVDTFGMKAIRRTLLGLAPHIDHDFTKNLDQDLNEKLNFIANDNNTDINFYKIYTSLSEEQKEKFEAALDSFNQVRQKQLENNAVIAAQERWKHDYEEQKEKGAMSFSKSLNSMLWTWSEQMMPLVEEELALCKKLKDPTFKPPRKTEWTERAKYAPFFSLLSSKKMTAITILEILKLNSTGGVADGMRVGRAVLAVANALELEYRSEQVKKSEHSVFKDVKNPQDLKKFAKSLAHFKSDKLSEWKISWPTDAKSKIGSLLITMLMHVAKVKVEGVDPVTKQKVHGEAPAFYHGFQYVKSIKVGIIRIHRSLSTSLSSDSLVGAVQPQFLPMLVKPRPWSSWNNGGYLYSQNSVVRSKDSPEQIAYLKASSDKLDAVYEGLNVLGNTAWTVNERVFNIMSHIWNTGEEFLDIPPMVGKFEYPPAPDSSEDPSVIATYKADRKKAQHDHNNYRSVRCDANYKLEIARAFLGEKMYFPHNMDFRGRAYPLSPNFNHLGNDLSRGLLIFWRGKPLGEEGLKWLKVHLSNLFGIDKAPLHERIAFVEENLDKVFKTADDPLGYQEWWKSADKPWQALATIFELADALRSPDPTQFISHQPVHQDGTCNGLQHYAALGGDVEGARQVNLTPSERPQDVYTHVAGLLIKRLEKLSAEGDEMATLLKDKIKRKVVKQTVMTNVYGVTYVGATAQINKQLENVFPDEDTYQYSSYLTKHVFACIRELFEGAHLIQDWLADCAKLISSSLRLDLELDPRELTTVGGKPPFMASVIWTTPLNLPIVQPYRAVQRKQISTNLQTVYLKDPFAISPVDSRKQMAAFPPNFIHSLDATHMLLSAIACSKKGLDFAAVHDSYWTHACDISTMNDALRDEFIKLHEVDLVARLKQEFDERYKGFLRIVKIPKNSEPAKKVAALRKELSQQLGKRISLGEEIYLEKRRQERLKSDDPAEVARGMSEVTTVSLLEGVDLNSLIATKTTTKRGKAVEVDDITDDESTGRFVKILAPLTLPDIPPKGDFDVQELRKSQYFFS